MNIIKSGNIEGYKKCIEDWKESKKGGSNGVFVIIDDNLSEYFQYFKEYKCFTLKAVESNKTLETVQKIYVWLLANGADRTSLLVGVGGGITTDITGFVAATYMRGIDCAFVPTTLLAMCDAGIGGKNGVNSEGFKNIIGTIREPKWIFICLEFLHTLPERVLKEGETEMLKTFLIADEKWYNWCVSYLSKSADATMPEFEKFIQKSQELKLEIVGQDLYEKGKRRVLNFGHSIGHAIEYIAGGQALHGEAVAVGIVMAAKASALKGLCSHELAEKIKNDFKQLGLPTSAEDFGIEEDKDLLLRAMAKDKKKEGENLHFIFIKKPGEVVEQLISIKELPAII